MNLIGGIIGGGGRPAQPQPKPNEEDGQTNNGNGAGTVNEGGGGTGETGGTTGSQGTGATGGTGGTTEPTAKPPVAQPEPAASLVDTSASRANAESLLQAKASANGDADILSFDDARKAAAAYQEQARIDGVLNRLSEKVEVAEIGVKPADDAEPTDEAAPVAAATERTDPFAAEPDDGGSQRPRLDKAA